VETPKDFGALKTVSQRLGADLRRIQELGGAAIHPTPEQNAKLIEWDAETYRRALNVR
jgi:hypothetical protein